MFHLTIEVEKELLKRAASDDIRRRLEGAFNQVRAAMEKHHESVEALNKKKELLSEKGYTEQRGLITKATRNTLKTLKAAATFQPEIDALHAGLKKSEKPDSKDIAGTIVRELRLQEIRRMMLESSDNIDFQSRFGDEILAGNSLFIDAVEESPIPLKFIDADQLKIGKEQRDLILNPAAFEKIRQLQEADAAIGSSVALAEGHLGDFGMDDPLAKLAAGTPAEG